jgi:hypothetical protein
LKVSCVFVFVISKTRKNCQTFSYGEVPLFKPSGFWTFLSIPASKISKGKPREIKNLEGSRSEEGVGIPLYIKFSKKLPLVF